MTFKIGPDKIRRDSIDCHAWRNLERWLPLHTFKDDTDVFLLRYTQTKNTNLSSHFPLWTEVTSCWLCVLIQTNPPYTRLSVWSLSYGIQLCICIETVKKMPRVISLAHWKMLKNNMADQYRNTLHNIYIKSNVTSPRWTGCYWPTLLTLNNLNTIY